MPILPAVVGTVITPAECFQLGSQARACMTCTGQGAACHACSHDGCITTLCQCQQARQTVHNPGASWSQLLSLQIKLEELSTDARIVEMLKPPRTWSHVGTWTLGLEHLLMELVPKDKAYAIQRVRAALQ